jgi:hypothetical protein
MTKLTSNTSGMPWGTGALSLRSGSYWMIYKDERGRRVQVNTHIKDFAAAQRLLAEACIPAARVRLAVLVGMAYEKPSQGTPAKAGRTAGAGTGKQSARVRARHGQGDRPVRRNAKSLQGRTSGKGTN